MEEALGASKGSVSAHRFRLSKASNEGWIGGYGLGVFGREEIALKVAEEIVHDEKAEATEGEDGSAVKELVGKSFDDRTPSKKHTSSGRKDDTGGDDVEDDAFEGLLREAACFHNT